MSLDSDLNVFPDDFRELAEYLEATFGCSGMCRAQNFWVFKDVRDGPPPKACLVKLTEDFNNQAFPIGIVVAINAFVIGFAFIGHFCLYCPMHDSVIENAGKRRFIN